MLFENPKSLRVSPPTRTFSGRKWKAQILSLWLIRSRYLLIFIIFFANFAFLLLFDRSLYHASFTFSQHNIFILFLFLQIEARSYGNVRVSPDASAETLQ